MRRHAVLASLLLLGIGLLAGCGQKGPLFLPPPKPVLPPSATSTPPPVPATTAPARPASAVSPVPARSG